MARHYIKNDKGNDVRTSRGERLFWSDSDGDRNRNSQTVYRKGNGWLGGSSKVAAKYDPSKGVFKK